MTKTECKEKCNLYWYVGANENCTKEERCIWNREEKNGESVSKVLNEIENCKVPKTIEIKKIEKKG